MPREIKDAAAEDMVGRQGGALAVPSMHNLLELSSVAQSLDGRRLKHPNELLRLSIFVWRSAHVITVYFSSGPSSESFPRKCTAARGGGSRGSPNCLTEVSR